jgi:arsenate reductase
MAEGFLRSFGPDLDVYSAGTRAEGRVNPYAVKAMQEAGIDISGHHPEQVDRYLGESFDYVITVCDGAKEICPVFTGQVSQRLHIGFEDPAEARGSEEEVMPLYRKVRDQIRERFFQFYKQITI